MSFDLLKSREVKNTEINPIQNKNKNKNEKVPSIYGFDSSTKVIDYNYREEIRKIEENKKIKRSLKNLFKKQRETTINSKVNNVHKEILRDSFNQKFYLTEFKRIVKFDENSQNFNSKFNFSPASTKFETNSTENIENFQTSPQTENFYYNSQTSTDYKVFPHHFTSFFHSHTESDEGLEKQVKSIHLNNFLMKIKRESLKRSKENRENEIEKYHESYQTILSIKSMFLDAINKLEIFLKFIFKQKEIEKERLNNYFNEKMKIESDIKKIEVKTWKMKSIMDKLKEYRNFLICVKEKVTILPKYFYSDFDIQKEYNKFSEYKKNKNSFRAKTQVASLNLMLREKNSNNKNSFFGKDSKISSTKIITVRKDSGNKNPYEDEDSNSFWKIKKIQINEKRFERYKYITDFSQIFRSTSEFFEVFKSLENQNIQLVIRHNDILEKSKIKNKRPRFLSNEIESSADEITSKENILNELKLKNRLLKQKIKEIKSPCKGKHSLHDSHSAKNLIFFEKIKKRESYSNTNINTISSNNIIIKNSFNKNKDGKKSFLNLRKISQNLNWIHMISSIYEYLKIYLNIIIKPYDKFQKSYEEERILFKLKEIEKGLNFLRDKMASYKKSYKRKKLQYLQIELEKERKMNVARELRAAEERRVQIMNKDIMRKNRVYFIQRKMATRYEPFENNKTTSNGNDLKSRNEFEDFISF
jgi:hypothetical protein